MSGEKVEEIKITGGDNDLLIKALVMYLLAPFGGLFFLNDPDTFVKFNAKQSIYLGFAIILLSIPLSIISFIGSLIPFAIFCIMILVLIIGVVYLFGIFYLIIKVKDRVKVKLPIIGNMAEK